MASTLPTLNYTTPEEFVNYYYEQLKTDLSVYDLQISKVGFVGYFLNLLGYTHFDLKQYYDSLFKEAFVGTSQTEEAQYLQAATYGYIPLFATPSAATGTVEFDMINWLPRRASNIVRREVIVGYSSSSGQFVPASSTFKIGDIQFSIDAFYKFIEVEDNGSYYYTTDIITMDGSKFTYPSSSSTISVPLYSTSQYVKKEITTELKPYNFGAYQTYYFGIDPGYFLSNLEVYVTESGADSSTEEQYTVKYTKYLEKGNDKSVFLRKITASNYVIEFGSGLRGKWISSATVRMVIKSTRGTSGNLIDKTNLKIQLSGNVFAFDYERTSSGQLSSTASNPIVMQAPLVNFEYSEAGLDSLSGEDLRDAIIRFIQTRDNLISRQDYNNIALLYYSDFKFLFKKFNVFDNTFYLCRSFRDRSQTIFYSTNHTEQAMCFSYVNLPAYTITAIPSSTGTGTLITGIYSYFVMSVDEWGRSNPSEIKTVTIDNGTGEDSVLITFDGVPYATSYRVYGRYETHRDQYWEILATSPQLATYTYTDDGTAGVVDVEPTAYELQDILYRPQFTLGGQSFISPYIYKGDTRMNYYNGYIIKDLARVDFSEIIEDSVSIGTGFDIPMLYLNLEYDEALFKTVIKLKSYQTINYLVFNVSITGENISIANKRMTCFPLANNYFEYEYLNSDTFGIFEGALQIEIKGGISTSIVSGIAGNYTIVGGVSDVLKIKFNDSSTGYADAFSTVTLTAGSRTASQIASDINIAIGSTVASIYTDDSGYNYVKIIPPSGGVATNVFIATTDSTCLTVLGLIGNDAEPAVLNGPLTTLKFTSKTGKFYQLLDVSDQIKLIRYDVGNESYVINIPVVDDTTFETDPDYYLDKIKNFIVDSSFRQKRMVTDNVQFILFNTYLLESPFIEATFKQSATIFSNIDYVFLAPIVEIRDFPPVLVVSGVRVLVSATPVGGSEFDGHANEIATYGVGWTFYTPVINDFVLDSDTNIYYTWNGVSWINIPSIKFPLKISVKAKADKSYVQKNSIDITTERENLVLALAEYLQKGFSGASIIFYNSLIVEFVHSNRSYIKSVKVYVTDSSTVSNEMDNGFEVNTDTDILKNLKNKLDIVKYTPASIWWDVDNISVELTVE